MALEGREPLSVGAAHERAGGHPMPLPAAQRPAQLAVVNGIGAAAASFDHGIQREIGKHASTLPASSPVVGLESTFCGEHVAPRRLGRTRRVTRRTSMGT